MQRDVSLSDSKCWNCGQKLVKGPKPGWGMRHVMKRTHNMPAWVFSKRSVWKNFHLLKQGSDQVVDASWRYFNEDSAVLKIKEHVHSRKNGLWNKIWTIELYKTQPKDIGSVSEKNFNEFQYDWVKGRCGQEGRHTDLRQRIIYLCVFILQRYSNDQFKINKIVIEELIYNWPKRFKDCELPSAIKWNLCYFRSEVPFNVTN